VNIQVIQLYRIWREQNLWTAISFSSQDQRSRSNMPIKLTD